jgi:hypothetical protein
LENALKLPQFVLEVSQNPSDDFLRLQISLSLRNFDTILTKGKRGPSYAWFVCGSAAGVFIDHQRFSLENIKQGVTFIVIVNGPKEALICSIMSEDYGIYLFIQVGLDIFITVEPQIQNTVSGSETSSRFFPIANLEAFLEEPNNDSLVDNDSPDLKIISVLENGNIRCNHRCSNREMLIIINLDASTNVAKLGYPRKLPKNEDIQQTIH